MHSWNRGVGFGFVVTLVALASAPGCKTNSIDNQTNNSSNTGGVNVIGPQGGIVLGPEGASVRISAGALTKDETISIRVAEPGQYPPLPGTYSTLSKVFAFEPHGLKFLTPAIITLPFTADGQGNAGVTGIRAEGTQASATESSWQPITAQVAVDAQISTPSFSYYALARTAQAPAEAGASCSGRGPDNSALVGTVSNLSGTVNSNIGAAGSTIDLSKLVDGYATRSPDGKQVTLTFTSYARACGYVKNGVAKIGGESVSLLLVGGVDPITTQTYPTPGVSSGGVPSTTAPGPCGLTGGAGSASGGAAGPGLSITAIDAAHVTGSFDYTPPGGTRLQGTFDLPICTGPTNVGSCCIP
jgi:hypothetical protein